VWYVHVVWKLSKDSMDSCFFLAFSSFSFLWEEMEDEAKDGVFDGPVGNRLDAEE
jgi:hypothetical protein